jgi:hypothetical protein
MKKAPEDDPDNIVREALEGYAKAYDTTLKLVDELISGGKHPQEVLLLLCARLDALASNTATEENSSKRTFIKFLHDYAANERKFLGSVSAGDVYYEIDFHLWLMEGTIPSPGRITRFSTQNDPIIQLIDISGIPITQADATRLLSRCAKVLREHYRVAPHQRKSKPLTGSATEMRSRIIDGIKKHYSDDVVGDLPAALEPLLASKTVSTILYEKFRSAVVHAGYVQLDEARFFKETNPYFIPLSSEFYGPFLLVQFPARYLRNLIQTCLTTYMRHLQATKKLPPDIAFQHYVGAILDAAVVVDEALLPRSRTLRLKMPGR